MNVHSVLWLQPNRERTWITVELCRDTGLPPVVHTLIVVASNALQFTNAKKNFVLMTGSMVVTWKCLMYHLLFPVVCEWCYVLFDILYLHHLWSVTQLGDISKKEESALFGATAL